MKKLIITFTTLGVLIALQGCLVSRTARPKLTGFIYDAISKQPVNGCKVGDSYTDSAGYYELAEQRYREFTFIGMEAPPIFVQEIVEMQGYEKDTIKGFDTFGGGTGKGAHWQIDTIFLKEKNEK